MVNFDLVNELWESGLTYREIWIKLNPPIRYHAFEKACIKYKKKGWVTVFRVIKESNRPSVEYGYKSKDEAIELLRDGCRLRDLGPDPIKSSDLIDEVRADGYSVVFANGLFYLCDKVRDWRDL